MGNCPAVVELLREFEQDRRDSDAEVVLDREPGERVQALVGETHATLVAEELEEHFHPEPTHRSTRIAAAELAARPQRHEEGNPIRDPGPLGFLERLRGDRADSTEWSARQHPPVEAMRVEERDATSPHVDVDPVARVLQLQPPGVPSGTDHLQDLLERDEVGATGEAEVPRAGVGEDARIDR